MDHTKQMLQAILSGQNALKQELVSKIDKVDQKVDALDQKVDKLGERLDGKIDSVEERLTKRLDNIGRQLAYLEDDAPTREEFDGLEKRVVKVEQRSTPTS